MENVTQAIYMAFAVLVFSLALTMTMTVFSQARATSDAVLFRNDETNFMEYNSDIGNLAQDRSRIVGLETVIPTLFKYYKENYTVLFRSTTDPDYAENPEGAEPLLLYKSQTDQVNWQVDTNLKTYSGKLYSNTADVADVFTFDLDEETKRNEPWTGSVNHIKDNLIAFLNGDTFESPSGDGESYTYPSFISNYSGRRFLEQIGEYVPDDATYDSTYNATDPGSVYEESGGTVVEIDGEIFSLLTQNKKRVVIYTLLP